ncbi:MAG TPA: hypothetical protein VIK60_05550 [Vicinamibacterales bacterium]
MLAVVDTGPLYAVVDQDDADHVRCRAALEQARYRLIIPTMVIAEATYNHRVSTGVRDTIRARRTSQGLRL